MKINFKVLKNHVNASPGGNNRTIGTSRTKYFCFSCAYIK